MDAGRLDGAQLRLLIVWISITAVITAVAVAFYAGAQQIGRLGADDVPRALAHRSAQLLSQGGVGPSAVALGPLVDLASDLSPFVTVYDGQHRILASTATLAGARVTVPVGVLEGASAGGEDHVTWQPRDDVREAIVAQPWQNSSGSGVVVAGVSLTPTEGRARQIQLLTAIAWLCGVLVETGAVALWAKLQERRR